MAKQTFTTGQVLTAAQMTSLQQTAMGGGSATAKTASYVLVAADAGTTIIMNSASATTITVNTALFAAGDTVFVLNQGAGVCTITAGTATVSTAASLALAQNETGQLYFLSTSAAVFTDYAQASGSASGMTLIKRASFSSVANTGTTFDSMFSSTYGSYYIVFESISAGTTTADFYLQFRYAGPTTQAASYSFNRINTTAANATIANSNNNGIAQLVMNTEMGGANEDASKGYLLLTGINGTSVDRPTFAGFMSEANIASFNTIVGYCYQERIYTGFICQASTSNISGRISVYGLATV
jgi:hypothetical protein